MHTVSRVAGIWTSACVIHRFFVLLPLSKNTWFFFPSQGKLVSLACCGGVVSVAESRLTLCDPMNGSLPASSVHGISQARTLVWVAVFFSRGSSWPRDWTCVSCISKQILNTEPPGKPLVSSRSFIFCPHHSDSWKACTSVPGDTFLPRCIHLPPWGLGIVDNSYWLGD